MKQISNLVYNETYGEFGLGDLYLPDQVSEKTPLCLAIHGGGWCGYDKYSFSGVADFLCKLGFAVYNIHYRLTGVKPWPACGDDCLEAARFFLTADRLEFAGLCRKKLFVIGGSAGGHLALMTGLRLPADQVSGIVSISGIAKFETYMDMNPERYRVFFGMQGPCPQEKIDAASPMSYINRNNPPILLTHAIYDKVVPIESATAFEDAARDHGGRIESYYYNRRNDGHCIWIKDSDPHKLHPDIEKRIEQFISTLSLI